MVSQRNPEASILSLFVNISNVICLYSDMHENPATWTGRWAGWPPSLDYFSKVIRKSEAEESKPLLIRPVQL
jgi:hypothetical protein